MSHAWCGVGRGCGLSEKPRERERVRTWGWCKGCCETDYVMNITCADVEETVWNILKQSLFQRRCAAACLLCSRLSGCWTSHLCCHPPFYLQTGLRQRGARTVRSGQHRSANSVCMSEDTLPARLVECIHPRVFVVSMQTIKKPVSKRWLKSQLVPERAGNRRNISTTGDSSNQMPTSPGKLFIQ